MSSFIDHLQFIPVPSRDGKRPPDGAHRPGGLGTRTLSDRLETLGWTGRIEDMAFEKPVPEKRIMEAYARGVADAVLSAWDRNRFPILLSTVSYGSLGAVDAYAPDLGLVWISPRLDYKARTLLKRPPIDRTALALATGRTKRDKLAVQPGMLPAEQIVHVGGWKAEEKERWGLQQDGAHCLARAMLDILPETVDAVDVERWVVHLDLCALAAEHAPAADGPDEEGFELEELLSVLEALIEARDVRCLALARYDLNRDESGTTVETLVRILDRLVLAAGGEPNPDRRTEAAVS